MPEQSPSAPSWWQTVPGILTGLAAIITAVTGLVIAFNRSPEPKDSGTAASLSLPADPGSGATSGSRSPLQPGAAGRAEPVVLPALNRVRLAGGDAVITILSAEVEPIDGDRRSLTLVIRYMNAGRYAANFWGRSYRLIVDDVPRAPTNFLDEVVEAESAKEGEVVFEVPVSAHEVVLQISSGEEKSRIALMLP